MQRRADITWSGDIRGSGKLRVGSNAFSEQTMTFSARTETQQGTTPEELIAAAHATCFAMAFSNTLKQEGSPPETLEVSAVCSLDRVDGGLKITAMDLTVTGRVPGIDDATFARLAEVAEGRCPVSNALRNNVEIRLKAAVAAGT
jgi:osmotically inducible protein OsmC